MPSSMGLGKFAWVKGHFLIEGGCGFTALLIPVVLFQKLFCIVGVRVLLVVSCYRHTVHCKGVRSPLGYGFIAGFLIVKRTGA